MNSLISVSLWIALVTVVPGFITIAAVFGAVAVVDPDYASVLNITSNEWIWGSVAVTVMILTQATGILLEAVLVNHEWLGPSDIPLSDGFEGPSETPGESIQPYDEYDRLYLLLVRIQEGEDAYGHLERAVAQFFLSNNTLVSFGIGIVTTVGLLGISLVAQEFSFGVLSRSGLYLGGLVIAFSISYYAAIARFQVMTVSAWSLRTNPKR